MAERKGKQGQRRTNRPDAAEGGTSPPEGGPHEPDDAPGLGPLSVVVPSGPFTLYEIDRGLVAARSALLDVVELLGPQSQCLVLVGAQAVYERTGYSAEHGAPPATSDTDLAVDPSLVSTDPVIGDVLTEAGYRLSNPDRPGLWESPSGVGVDLLAPHSIAGPGRRAARLGSDHGSYTVGRAKGLELAMIDHEVREVGSLTPHETRRCHVKVAGTAALLCAKWTKLGERLDRQAQRPDRVLPKDAVEVLRLMRATEPQAVAEVFVGAASHERYHGAARRAASYGAAYFAAPAASGCQLIGRGVGAGSAEAADLARYAADWTSQFTRALPPQW